MPRPLLLLTLTLLLLLRGLLGDAMALAQAPADVQAAPAQLTAMQHASGSHDQHAAMPAAAHCTGDAAGDCAHTGHVACASCGLCHIAACTLPAPQATPVLRAAPPPVAASARFASAGVARATRPPIA
ncbi:hypothetical protein SAMN05428957_10593 [Oryzisolibacter propanilivorax]|uniref:Uncharacterized protein n=1 Tax=Oryzisolibacter propanilivorax TaxID=1527607 RepID=A0A1G9SR88_9BURK|nr:hypothetical protein [Oryzisolibacter propanilivorax]SDM37874.1 hypothetical protein SAMN05428957_10593 [Oryzisolibacter propanilivorax]